MNKNQNSDEKSFISFFLKSIGNFVKRSWGVILLFILTFMASTAVVYFKATTTETVASYAVNEYEVGQISDRTIFATKSMSADETYPVSIEEGEKIIRKGFPITEVELLKLQKMADSPAYIDYRAFCNNVLFLLVIAVLWIVLFNPVILGRTVLMKELILESILFVLVYFVVSFGSKVVIFQDAFALSSLIPSSLCIFLVAVLFGQRAAFIFSFVITMGVLGANDFQIVPAFFTLATSISAARIVRKIERRIDLVFASILQAMLSAVFMVIIKVIFNSDFNKMLFVFPSVAFNGFISGILVLGLLTPLEYILNTASVFRLMDLNDQNTPILRKMQITAGGTYSHSMMVANLAETACKEIGANSLLARIGAYYHDIGKLDQPEYFVENQAGENKHNDLNPSLSASVIKSHVKRGIEKAYQLRLPKQVIDIIAEHHGNSVIAYFYNEAKKKDPSVAPEDFSYPGNPPVSKESAVVMLADTVEAACRTLEKPSVPRLDKFIQTLITGKIEGHQLEKCGLTFGELTVIKDSFVQVMASFYHSRTKYPNQKDPDEASPKTEETDTAEKQKEKAPSVLVVDSDAIGEGNNEVTIAENDDSIVEQDFVSDEEIADIYEEEPDVVDSEEEDKKNE